MSACHQEWCPNWAGDATCFRDQFDDCRNVHECDHDWMSRPESDTYECLICGEER